MHLLAAQAGAAQAEGEAIDLGQAPGEIVFASAADSELNLLAAATDRAGYDGLRLANVLRLSHPLSVDLWLDNTVRHTRLVVMSARNAEFARSLGFSAAVVAEQAGDEGLLDGVITAMQGNER